jgi:hypothetical protein
MPANSWKALPGTQMKDACPQPFDSYACGSVIAAWGGGAFDEKRDRMVIFGGGHSDSWYNNLFSFDLVAMKWSRLTEMPAGAASTPPPGWADMRTETCGYYPKGALSLPSSVMKGNYVDPAKCFVEPVLSQLDLQQPRSAHTYGMFFVDRVRDRYCSTAHAYYPSAQTESAAVPCFDLKTGLWTRMADRPAGVGNFGQTALDANGHVWALAGEAGGFGEYDPNADAWKIHGFNNYDAGGSSDVDRKRNQLYTLVNGNLVRRWNLASPASYTDVATSGDVPTNLSDRPGFVYADAKDRFFAWGSGRTVYTLDPATGGWKRFTATGDDPGAKQANGTYGRFRYVPSRGVFVLVNDVTQNVFIYKP